MENSEKEKGWLKKQVIILLQEKPMTSKEIADIIKTTNKSV